MLFSAFAVSGFSDVQLPSSSDPPVNRNSSAQQSRAYLITAGQSTDITAQEMYRIAGTDIDLGPVLAAGLREAHGWDVHRVANYLAHLRGVRGHWTPATIAAL